MRKRMIIAGIIVVALIIGMCQPWSYDTDGSPPTKAKAATEKKAEKPEPKNPEPKPEPKCEEEKWDETEARITEYCPSCNDPAGYQSSSGKYLEDGDCACSWLPEGTQVNINGNVYTVVDTCGTDAIDIFRDTDICQCDANYYTIVKIRR
ncbi:MAG: hypothetical protein VB031_02415 [Eubacteriaceae bacterium]|nr:hypothetical protein [Eubacteriaceae bacterium]